MIVVKIIGGLGNQLFQYSYAKSLQQKGYKVKIDISAFETYKLHGGYFIDRYLIDIELATPGELRRFGVLGVASKLKKQFGFKNNRLTGEEFFFFDDRLMSPEDDTYIQGYFQSEKYFLEIREVILSQISLKNSLSTYNAGIQKEISMCKISCSIHMRRGDYLTNSVANKVHGVLDIEYYKESIELLENKFSDNIWYFIFSDDMEWVVDNLHIKNSTFVDSDQDSCPNEDIFLMSLCDHNIIANSSFSWWGAWLNNNGKKVVISPKQWFMDKKMNDNTFDLIPSIWIRV